MKKKISLYVEEELYEKLKKDADKERRSLNSFILMMIDEAYNHPEIFGLDKD